MASNSEYEQQRFFKGPKFEKTPLFKKEYTREIPITFDKNGMFVVDNSNVSNNWNYIGEIDEIKKELDDRCADIIKIVKPKRELKTIKVKF